MGQGFTVKAGSLAQGGRDVTSLLTVCGRISSDAVSAMGGMADAASGHTGLMAALLGAAEQAQKTFMDISAAYQHVRTGLDQTAGTYAATEQDNTNSITAIRDGVIK